MEAEKKITNEEILTELETVLKYSSLKSSPVLTNFLRYVVEETVNENQHCIKEYSIAVNVLNRSSDFNSNDDAVVRIHAGRLRRVMNEYYLTQGQNNVLMIDIPKGSYIPTFIRRINNRIAEPLQNNNTKPLIAIFPFKSIIQDQNLSIVAEMLCGELSAELSRFDEIAVIGNFSNEMISKINQNALEAANLIGADFIVTGNLKNNDQKLQIRLNLLNASTGEFILTKSFEYESLEDFIKIQNEIIESVACIIGGYYGVIFKEIIKSASLKTINSDIWKGIYSYYKYQSSYSLENCLSAFTNLKQATKKHPDHALLWAMMGEFYLDGIAFAIEDNEFEEGYRCIMKSLQIDPNCQHVWHALTFANLFKKDSEACLHSAEQCIKINPNASGLVSGVGCMLIFAGYFDKGYAIMKNALEKNPNCPWWMNIGFCYYYIAKKDYTAALYWAEKMDAEETFWDPLLKAVTLSFTNQDSKAKKYLTKLIELEPEISQKINSALTRCILSENTIMQIIGSLDKIGLKRLVVHN